MDEQAPDFSWIGRRRKEGDRLASNPVGMECQNCGCIFLGAIWHSLCRVCHEANQPTHTSEDE